MTYEAWTGLRGVICLRESSCFDNFLGIVAILLKDPLGGPWGVVPKRLTPKHVILSTGVIYLAFSPHMTVQNSTTKLYNTLVELTSFRGVTLYLFVDTLWECEPILVPFEPTLLFGWTLNINDPFLPPKIFMEHWLCLIANLGQNPKLGVWWKRRKITNLEKCTLERSCWKGWNPSM